MKVIQINNFYEYGSTGKLVDDIHTFMMETGNTSFVLYGRGKKEKSKKNIYKIAHNPICKIESLLNRIGTLQYGGALISTYRAIKFIKRENPDLVHLHCLNGNFINTYFLLNYLKKNKISTVITLHAEFMYTGNCAHAYDCERYNLGCGSCGNLYESTKSKLYDCTNRSWNKMYNAYKGFDNLYVVSMTHFFYKRAYNSTLLNNAKHFIIPNGIDTNVFCFNGKKEKKGYILFVSPEFSVSKNHSKGGHFIVELAKRLPDLQFVVVGSVTEKNIGLPKNINCKGEILKRIELSNIYSEAGVTLITSKKETFSMVCAESLCCGTPVVGFKAGGPESIAIKDYSAFVDYSNIDELEKELIKMIERKLNPVEISTKSIMKYNKRLMLKTYFDLYTKIVKGED